jgi:hypothetical protein
MVDFATLVSRLQSSCFMSFGPLSWEKDAQLNLFKCTCAMLQEVNNT